MPKNWILGHKPQHEVPKEQKKNKEPIKSTSEMLAKDPLKAKLIIEESPRTQ